MPKRGLRCGVALPVDLLLYEGLMNLIYYGPGLSRLIYYYNLVLNYAFNSGGPIFEA
jgi:hypothetical protein